MKAISEFITAEEFIKMQNDVINDNITYRSEWEAECKDVMYSFKGNKYPVRRKDRLAGTSTIIKDPKRRSFLNLIKRQYRITSNYLWNNEPQYLITAVNGWDVTEEDLENKRSFLNGVFEWNESDLDEVCSFYDTVMDDVIFYGLFRWLAWTIAYYDEKKKTYEFKSYDSMDTYIDLDARCLRDIKKIIVTYTKGKRYLEKKYPLDGLWSPIDWENVGNEKKQSLDTTKNAMLKDKPNSKTLIVREGYYVEDWKLYRILTTQWLLLEKEEFEVWFLPFTYYTTMNDPESLYPRGWYVDMLELEREINQLIEKINKIVKSGWRFVYVKEWTTLTKATNNLLNSMDIEVIEVAGSQDLPQQATFLQVTQADLQHLDFLMTQADMEGWMKADIMGQSSIWPDASGRAIMALQAWSKNNIGTALGELNKYMNRLVRIVLRLHDIYWEDKVSVKWQWGWSVEVDKKTFKQSKTKVTITWRDAFDEITKQMQSIQILDLIAKFKPDIKISPNTITDIFWVTNDIATKIQKDIDKEINPDLQIAEWENKKLMNAISFNANPSDDHQLHLAMHTELLKNFPPESDAGKAIINHANMHNAFLNSSAQ